MRITICYLFTVVLCFSAAIAAPLSVNIISQTNVTISGQSTGSVTLAASGGNAPYVYSKDGVNFQSSPTFNSLAAGNYTFTVRDASPATATVNTIVSQVAGLFLSVISQSNVPVIGQSTGSVTLFAAGGTAPYQYSKDGIAFQSASTFGGLAAGNYTFTVKDVSLNTSTVNVTITQSNVLTLYLNSQTNVTVIGQNTGSVTVSGAGGTPPYQYSKNGINYQSSGIFNSLPAGEYTFTIRDAAFNTSSLTTTITQPGPLAVTVVSKTDVAIYGQSTGNIALTGNGGTPPYQYSKDGITFQSSANFSSLPAANYTFTIRDAAMGTATVSSSINQAPLLVLTLLSKTDVNEFGKSTGSVSLSATGGTPPYQYSKNGSSFQSSPDFNSLQGGTYVFTLKDAATANATLTVVVGQPAFEIAGIKAMNNFSPNGDGVNDKWEIENVILFPDHSLTVFDRAGRVVYKVKNYKNDWDGTVNGSPLAEGTYYYALSFDTSGIGVKKGFITLIK